jgi:O-antigen/teichoic acid export membrane protein
MLTRFRFRSEFVRNAATLITGTTIAQAIPILVSPIMARLYSPQDYGLLAVYMSIVGLLAITATGAYTHAIILAEKNEDAINVVALCATVTTIVSLLTLLLVVFFRHSIAHLLSEGHIANWLLLVPLSVFLTGLYQTLNYWVNRQRGFKTLAINRVATSSVATFSQLGFGLLKFGGGAMVFTHIYSTCVGMSLLAWRFWREDRNQLQAVSRNKMRVEGDRHRRFPLYVLPTDFINVAANQLPILLLTVFVGMSGVGLYNFSQRLLGLPTSLISVSVLEVFKQRASSDYAKHGNCRDIYVKTFKSLSLISIAPFGLLFIFAPAIFAFIFGEKWREAGEYTRVLVPMIFLRFTSSPLSYVYYIAGRQKEDLLLHVYMIISSFVSLWVGHLLFTKSLYVILCFSLNHALIYLVYLIRSYSFSKGNSALKCAFPATA